MLDRVAQRALQRARVEGALDQVVGDAQLARADVDLAVVHAREHDHRRVRPVLDDALRDLEAVLRAEPVVDEVDVVKFAADDLLERSDVARRR